MATVLPIKSHHSADDLTSPTTFSDTYEAFTVAYRQWIPSYPYTELPIAGDANKSGWLPRDWVLKPSAGVTVEVVMHFEPDGATWKSDSVRGMVWNSTQNKYTTVVPNTMIMTNGSICTPPFAQGTTTMALTSMEEYVPLWEFSSNMFDETMTCKSWISITQTSPPLEGSSTNLIFTGL